MHPHRRRKKKRNGSNGIRSLEIIRSTQGFGFTIAGQKPCILSSIVQNSPADLAGLRSGDFLISVNGMNVAKFNHETVVQLIGNSHKIRMSIAENYYSDSSDEEILQNQPRFRPKYPHNKTKLNRSQYNNEMPVEPPRYSMHHYQNSNQSHQVLYSPNAKNSADISNVSAMVHCSNVASPLSVASASMNNVDNMSFRVIVGYLGTIEMPKQIATSSIFSCIRKLRQEKRNPTIVLMNILPNCLNLLNSNSVILATYPSSRLNYVSSSSSDNNSKFFGLVTSAIYADDGMPCDSLDSLATRKDIVISNSCHVFVIDTKLIDHNTHLQKADKFNISCTKDPISNTCLEFPNNSEYICNLIRSMYNIKTPIKENEAHNRPAAMRCLNLEGNQNHHRRSANDQHDLMANSPQPSNHSEITTTSSNSDSGIGFHNDYANISDRILVVDFPGINQNRRLAIRNQNPMPYFQRQGARPFNDIQLDVAAMNPVRNIRSMNYAQPSTSSADLPVLHAKSKSADYNPINRDEHINSRLKIRAMPDPVSRNRQQPDNSKHDYENIYSQQINDHWLTGKTIDEAGNLVEERGIDIPEPLEICSSEVFSSPRYSQNNLLVARSCDDMMMVMDKEATRYKKRKDKHLQNSVDDMTIAIDNNIKISDDHVFLAPPSKPFKRNNNKKSLTLSGKSKSSYEENKSKGSNNESNLLYYKLSPKVFGLPRPVSVSFENLSSSSRKKLWTSKPSKKDKNEKEEDFSIWGSLQELRHSDVLQQPQHSSFLEGTYSEPSLNLPDEAKQITNELSPFKRWGQSSLRSRSTDARTPLQRRPSSLAVSENDVYLKATHDDEDEYSNESSDNKPQVIHPIGPTVWGQSFELLLNDPAGLHTFAEFLKKEFSGENIYFWTACERYRQINDLTERTKEALAIYDKHLAGGSLEPVNVDSHARTTARERLPDAEKDLFVQPQKQIFNLMKFDSYQRFIRSDLHKNCLDAEQKNIPLPYPGELLDPSLRITLHQHANTSNTMTKLKKSLSNAEDRRRKSLLPWHRKTRCKSKDRGEEQKESQKNSVSSSSNTLKLSSNHSAADIHSSRSSLSSFDATISKIGSFDPEDSRSSLCRVILSNGATTIVQTKNNETIRELVERLLDKRGIFYQAYEAFLSNTNKPLDLDGFSKQLSGNEVHIEQRVIFKLDLPNRKVISVKSKPCKVLGEVLRPILHKYNYRLDLVKVYGKEYTTSGSDSMDMSLPVTAVDGQRLQIVCKNTEEFHGEVTPIITSNSSPKQKQTPQNFKLGNGPVTFVRANKIPSTVPSNPNLTASASNPQLNTLDEITNKVFNELLQGKVDGQGMVNGVNGNIKPSEQGSIKSEDWGSEASSGIFSRMRRHRADSSAPASNRGGSKSKKSSGGSEESDVNAMKKPLIAKWKNAAGVKLQVTNRTQNDELLLEGLKRAQRSRLEDQRGTEINFELPDFLKDKEKYSNVGNKLRKTKFNESPSNSISLYNNIDICNNNDPSKMNTSPPQQRPPQPAPRLSIVSKSPTKSSPDSVSFVQSKINCLENTILMNSSTSSAKFLTGNSRSNTPVDLNLSTQCMASNTPIKARGCDSPIYNQPIYYSPDSGGSGIYADTTMVFNHHQASSSFESHGSENDPMNYFNNNQHDYQEIEESNRNRERVIYEESQVPPLPPKPKVLPIKPSNWQNTNNNNKENFFKVPQELRRAPLLTTTEGAGQTKNDVYLDQPTSSFV